MKGEWWGVRGLRHALDGLDLLLTLAVLVAKRHAHEHALGADLVARHAGDGEEELLCYSEKVLGPVVALAHLDVLGRRQDGEHAGDLVDGVGSRV